MTSTTEITLNADKSAVALKAIKDVGFALATIAEFLSAGRPLNSELAFNTLAVSEFYLADLTKLLGVETNGARQVEDRNALLRVAHERVRELEKIQGGTVTPQLAQLQLKNLSQQLNEWWKVDGFGHVSETNFGQYGCEVVLSCHLFGHYALVSSDTPVSDKQSKLDWHQRLRDRGFVLMDNAGEICIQDCNASRTALISLLALRLPSGKITETRNHSSRDGVNMCLRDIKVYIRDISDIATLPVPVNDVE